MSDISLRVTVPVCSFRKPYAREFLESERVPPPATVYGFLLSLIGEEDRYQYRGTEIAIAVMSIPEVSTVLRTTWRVKKKIAGPGLDNNRRPDYQEILTGLEFGVWIKDSELSHKLQTIVTPEKIERYGGLSLGESRDLVNDVCYNPTWGDLQLLWLECSNEGNYPMPVWVDHVGSAGTRWEQFKLVEGNCELPLEKDQRWIKIAPPQ